MAQDSFYWHDYETFGIDPQRDGVAQFAGIRTDLDFNVIGEPLVIYCKPTDDKLPQPEACCVTGITPQLAAEKGVCEAEFIGLIHAQMAQANTCTLGYNNLRFDDEVTRNLLYRNFYDPYTREWQNGNSRWDLIDLARTMYALRPDGLQWPVDDKGVVSLRLEKLTEANGIKHADAHDALSDVYATIEFAKLMKQAQPKLFQFFWENRGKQQLNKLLQLGSYQSVVHVSGMYGAMKNFISLVVPICQHPVNSNGVIVYDLSINPEVMLSLSAEEIKQRIFTAQADLPEGVERIPLKTVHINKCPVIAPAKVLRPADALRLNIDVATCQVHCQMIAQDTGLIEKLNAVFSANQFEPVTDPDLMIYSGGFFSARDKQVINEIRELTPEQLIGYEVRTDDDRIGEMLFRYRARNYPESLNTEEHTRWQAFCNTRLHHSQAAGFLDFATYRQKIAELKQQEGVDQQLMLDLETYAVELENKLRM
jgi:exodeoxyribonuclease-1